MNKVIFHLLITLPLIGCVSTHDLYKSNIGFRGVLLGSSPLPKMKPLEKWRLITATTSREISNAYSIPDEPLRMGSLAIKEDSCEYIDEKLLRIEVNLSKDTQAQCPKVSEIVSALESQYGISMTQNKSDPINSLFSYQWRGNQARISYLCAAVIPTNVIEIESIYLNEEMQKRLKIIKSSMQREESEKIKRSLQ